MKPYVIYSILICLFEFETLYGQQFVKQCPLDITSWYSRSAVLDCDAKGLKYHCILTYNGILVEVCIKRKIYEANRIGCPWIHFHNNEPIFGAKNTKCPIDLEGCPPIEHRGYESDQLYLYPKCLVPEKDRIQKRTDVTVTYVQVTQTTKPDDSDSKIVEISVIVLMSSLLILCLLVILHLWKSRNHAKRDNAAEPESDDFDNAAEPESDDFGDSEMRSVPMKHLRDQIVSVSKYNCIRDSGCQCHRESKTANSETRIVMLKCMDKLKLRMEIETFKDKINVDPSLESAPLIERINEVGNRFHSARYRFQTMIVVFFDVNKSTVDIVRNFTKFLQEHCCVVTCIAFSNDKDVFLNTNEYCRYEGVI